MNIRTDFGIGDELNRRDTFDLRDSLALLQVVLYLGSVSYRLV